MFIQRHRRDNKARATHSISKHFRPHFAITGAIVILPSSATSRLSCYLAAQCLGFPTSIIARPILQAGILLPLVVISQLFTRAPAGASFEILSASMDADICLLATNSFFVRRRLSSVSEGALAILKRSLKKGMVLHGPGQPWNPF